MFSLAFVYDVHPVLIARGRGLGKLIEGLWNGEPAAWIILGVVVAGMVAIGVFKRMSGSE
jgi:hypothetical protein